MPLVDVLERLGRPAAVAALDGEDAVYVVGGAVRDVLLGRRPHELDFVVEGDAVAVARRAADRLGGSLTVHDRFGTATVTAPDGQFDLAGARRERYPRPGALPEVELGTSVCVLAQRQPVLLAKQIATVDQLSGGRVRLGVGAGWLAEEFAALGVAFGGRGQRTDDAIAST